VKVNRTEEIVAPSPAVASAADVGHTENAAQPLSPTGGVQSSEGPIGRTRNFDVLGRWHDMLTQGRLKKVVLGREATFLNLRDRNVKQQYIFTDPTRNEGEKQVHRYYDDPIPGEPLSESTLFVYEPGRHKPAPGHKIEIAGVYLKKVIRDDCWRAALGDPARNLPGLKAMAWEKPHRSETRPAIERQRGRVDAGELVFGTTHQGSLEKAHAHQTEDHNYAALAPLLKVMDLIFAIVLPSYWLLQSQPKTLSERRRIQASLDGPKDWGGALNRFKHFGTAFTNSALLRSCPAAIHQDNNSGAGPNVTNFTCLTSCGEGFDGGTFCLIEYGITIPVTPGDLLICQTSREWHTNLGPVNGEKYSVVAYYRPCLVNPRYATGPSMAEETAEDRLKDWFITAEEGDFYELGHGKSTYPVTEDDDEADY